MCTLTYLPTTNGFALASSRDEMRDRGSMARPDHNVLLRALYPVDERSGGTWILTSAAGFSVNLLNGGHVRHLPGGRYRHSRGLVPLLFAEAGSIDGFMRSFDPGDIEPFTLVVIVHTPRMATSIVWTGMTLERFDHAPDTPCIWSSSTLYDERMKAEREQWFFEAIAQNDARPGVERLIDFHLNGGIGKAPISYTIRMARERGPETICLTGITYSDTEWAMCYYDLVADAKRTLRMIG